MKIKKWNEIKQNKKRIEIIKKNNIKKNKMK